MDVSLQALFAIPIRKDADLPIAGLTECNGGCETGFKENAMKTSGQRLMKESEIPAFVQDVIDAGCDICAVGHEMYVIGDADLSPSEQEAALPALKRIDRVYGDRDFLKLEIVAHLRSLGRYLDLDSTATHWSENAKFTQ